MTEHLHVFWVRSVGRQGLATDAQMAATLKAFKAAAGPDLQPRPYRLVEGGQTTSRLGYGIHHVEPPFHSRLTDAGAPDLIMLTPVPDLNAARLLNLRITSARDAREFEIAGGGLYTTLQSWPGIDPPEDEQTFAEAIQFGTYDTGTPEDEWALADYYADVRMPAFVSSPGTVRARRLTTGCAAPGRTAVLYEFSSLKAREENFEPLEGQEVASRAIALTRHGALSPSIAVRLR